MLDERALSERLGVSRTPIREAIAMLEQDGFVRRCASRHCRGPPHQDRDRRHDPAWQRSRAWPRGLITTTARKKDISALRDFFRNFGKDRLPQDHVEEYSKANIAFHQALISLSESPVLVDMTNDILLHVRGYRQLTIGRKDRTATSLPEHMAIIEALEARDTELAEKRSAITPSASPLTSKRTARNCFSRRNFHSEDDELVRTRRDQGEAECPQ